MCECGCGNFNPYKSFKVGDKVLAVEIYPGCENCGTGIMVVLNIFTPEEADHYDLHPTEEFKPDENGWANMNFPIIGKEDLTNAIIEVDKDGYDSWEDYLSENGLELLQCGLRLRLAEVDKENK